MRTLSGSALLLALTVPVLAAPALTRVITPAQLAPHLDDANLVILYVGDRKTYDAGHIRGARFVELNALAAAGDAANGLTLQMPPAGALRDDLAALGVSDASYVVVYTAGNGWAPSARVVFTLDYAGLTNVSWLDGGLGAWTAAGQPVTTDVPAPHTGALSPLKVRDTIVDAAFVKAHAHSPGFVLVDARNPDFYNGTRPSGARGFQKEGHIPGAVNVPFDSVITSDLRLKGEEEIVAAFSKAGVNAGDTVVAYCHIGMQATAALFAAGLAGHPVLLYDGSFEDWTKRDLPIEK